MQAPGNPGHHRPMTIRGTPDALVDGGRCLCAWDAALRLGEEMEIAAGPSPRTSDLAFLVCDLSAQPPRAKSLEQATAMPAHAAAATTTRTRPTATPHAAAPRMSVC